MSVYDADTAATGPGVGIIATSGASKALLAQAAGSGANFAVYAFGNLTATGTKSFEIDHPLDPTGSILRHFCEEGPAPYDVYRGTVSLGADGTAWVSLPDYFGAINKDLTYQLTCVGGYAPVFVSSEVQNNRFRISGGKAGLKVSWQVTGVRNDAYVRFHGYTAEEKKPANEKGLYLSPEAYGFPQTRSTAEAHTLRKYPDGRVVIGGKEQPRRP
jgi:hypothetical protein